MSCLGKMRYGIFKKVSVNLSTIKFFKRLSLEIWVSYLYLFIFKQKSSEVFYTGLPTTKFPDFEKLIQYVIGGELLNNIAKHEANEQILTQSADHMKTIQRRMETTVLDDAVTDDTVNQHQEIENLFELETHQGN